MADEARLTIVIEEPTAAAGAGAGPPRPADDLPGWYPRYRELRNRADDGRIPLTPAERAELDDLGRQLTAFASAPPAPAVPPPMPPATAAAPTAAAGGDGDGRALRYRAMQKQAAAGAPLRPFERSQLAQMEAEYGRAASPLPAYGAYTPPTPAPANFGLPPPPPPPPPSDGGLSYNPNIPGWDGLYAGLAGRHKFAGTTTQAMAAAGNAAIGEGVAAARAAKKKRAGKAWQRQFDGWQGREAAAADNRQRSASAFDSATNRMSPRKQAMLGAALGGAQASAAGTSLAGGAATGAMAAAGGPVGLALLAKDAVDEFKKKILAAPAEAIEAVGEVAKKVAGNDGLGLFKTATGAAAGALEKVPFVGENLAAGIKTATAAVTVFADVATAFAGRGKELSGYSGALAGSVARTEVANITADIREAEVLGPDLSKLMDLVTDFDQGTRELLLPIKKMAVEELVDFLTYAKDFMGGLLAIAEGLPGPLGDLAKEIRRGMDLDEEKRRLGLDTDPIRDWLNAADGLGPVGMPVQAAPGDGAAMLPAFGR